MPSVPKCPFLPFDEKDCALTDQFFMKCAYNEALRAWQLGEIPIGAVAVVAGKIVARACNQVESMRDATAHAEMEIIRYLSKQKSDWRLNDVTLYVTKEPCPMCSGAIHKARIPKVVLGVWDEKQGCLGGCINFSDTLRLYHHVDVTCETLEGACETLLLTFFKLRRQQLQTKPPSNATTV